jgi:hypothetical protein
MGQSDTKYTSRGIAFRAFGSSSFFDTPELRTNPAAAAGQAGLGIAPSGNHAGNRMPNVVQPDYVAPATALVPPPAGTRASVTDEIFSALDHTLLKNHKHEWELELVDLDFLPEG